jgi:N-sulfoglucosamine sulfohydrolase
MKNISPLCLVALLSPLIQILASERPNILWITSEDNNVNWVGCYGNPHANTPHIDKLASEGFQYMNCFANAPVCAPYRCVVAILSRMIRLNTTPII